MNCEHQCSRMCLRQGCRCDCHSEFHEVVEDITKGEWIEKEVAAHPVELGAHSKSVLRSMKGKEFDYWEREAVRIDSNNSHDDY